MIFNKKLLCKTLMTSLLMTSIGFTTLSHAADDGHDHGTDNTPIMNYDEMSKVRALVKDVLSSNTKFRGKYKKKHFEPFLDAQHPRATVVTCSDSRVHTHAFSQDPDGDLFMIRNIGNQMSTAEGSVEYGVHHLHTPLLVFLGHSACGAIKAASGEYGSESEPIKRELDTIKIPKGIDNLSGVKMNVDNQVSGALRKFESYVKSGKLTIIGAVYDFKDSMGKGYGTLNIINVNGMTDTNKIREFTNQALSTSTASSHKH